MNAADSQDDKQQTEPGQDVPDDPQVAPEEALHVGDSLTSDVAGAKGVGMYAVWINRKKVARPQNAPSPDSEIDNLQDVVPLLALHETS